MIYQRKGKRSAARPEFIQLEQEGTRARMSSSGSDGYVRLKDEHGNTWAGLVEQGPGDLVYCRLRDVSGVATASVRVFRDDRKPTRQFRPVRDGSYTFRRAACACWRDPPRGP